MDSTTLDDFETVSRDNFRQVRDGHTCYTYKDDVLARTIELLDKANVEYIIKRCDGYVSISKQRKAKQ